MTNAQLINALMGLDGQAEVIVFNHVRHESGEYSNWCWETPVVRQLDDGRIVLMVADDLWLATDEDREYAKTQAYLKRQAEIKREKENEILLQAQRILAKRNLTADQKWDILKA